MGGTDEEPGCLIANTGSAAIKMTRASHAGNRRRPRRRSTRHAVSRPPAEALQHPGFREAVRCARCGNELMAASAWSPDAQCARCGADLHSCAQCAHFDTSATYECQRRSGCAFAEGRQEHLSGVRAEDNGRTRDQVGGADQRAEGVRRSVQVTRDVFVTGGTGYLGQALIDALASRGHRVRALARPGSESKVPSGAGCVTGNALDAGTWAAAVPPADTLVHLVGTPHPSPAKAAEFQRVDCRPSAPPVPPPPLPASPT